MCDGSIFLTVSLLLLQSLVFLCHRFVIY